MARRGRVTSGSNVNSRKKHKRTVVALKKARDQARTDAALWQKRFNDTFQALPMFLDEDNFHAHEVDFDELNRLVDFVS